MTGQELHIPERASGPVNEPCCPRDECEAPGMRRAAFQADLVERSVEPNHDAQRRHLATALGANDVCRVSRRLGPRSLGPRSLAPRRLAPRRERLAQVGMKGDQPPTALLGGTVAQLNDAADLALGIEHHVPRQRGNLASAHAGFRRQQHDHTVAERISGPAGKEKPFNLDDLVETVRMTVSDSDISDEGGLRGSIEAAERTAILEALVRNDWAISKTAQFLGISRKNLWEKMRRYHIGR